MSQKVKNLWNIWEKEGYHVTRTLTKRKGRKVLEVHLEFCRRDGQPVVFHKEWDVLKRLASRQNFYILPVFQDDQNEINKVALIDKQALLNKHALYTSILTELEKSYWYVQNDLEFRTRKEEAATLRSSVYKMMNEVRQMKSMSALSFTITLFEDYPTYQEWLSYKERLLLFLDGVRHSERISLEIQAKVVEVMESVNFSQ